MAHDHNDHDHDHDHNDHDHDHDHNDHDHDHDHNDHDHVHGHGHAGDQGVAGALRYLRNAPRMWRSAVNDAVVKMVAPRAGETVVDIGAGMGAAAVRAASSGALVVAVEPTPFLRWVVSARRLFSKHRKSISIRDGSAEALPLRDGEANAIWAVNTMHHWIDLTAGIAEVARVLAPGGRAVLVDEDFSDPDHPDHEAWIERHGEDSNHGFSMVDASEVGDLLRAAGIAEVVAESRLIAEVPALVVTAHLR